MLLKEVLDNSVDEFMMGFGKSIEITINEEIVKVRDYGRGIPLGKLSDVVSKMNTGAKYDSRFSEIRRSERSGNKSSKCAFGFF